MNVIFFFQMRFVNLIFVSEIFKQKTMNLNSYLLISILIFSILLYPLLRKAVSLLEIFVNKYVQQSNIKTTVSPVSGSATTTQTVLNLKLLAYERIILFIERMKPDSLIPRTLSQSMTNKDYQLLLINEIRKEFEYNLSQQLYLSDTAWTAAVNFKDRVITLINTASADCISTQPAGELARKILENYITSDLKVEQILQVIKQDIN